MPDISILMVLIPALPLLAALVTAGVGKNLLREASHLPAVICIGASFLLSLLLLAQVYRQATAFAEREYGAQEESQKGSETGAADQSEAGHHGEPVHHDKHGPSGRFGFEQTRTLWTWCRIDGALDKKLPAPHVASHVASGEALADGDTAALESAATDPGGANFAVGITLRADVLTSMMLSMVTFVALLVVIYASAYMHGDDGYARFFAYVSLFVFSMTMLVSSSNFLLLYVFWEAVGVCSYLLIGFWYAKPEASAAAKKAFLVNRIGDFGFALGVFLIWTTYGTLNFHDTAEAAGVLGYARVTQNAFATGGLGLAIALLLFVGACGKSAQFPLHVWLPDAMEGPSPVSALIHAATMVTAGVYMVARCMPLFLAGSFDLGSALGFETGFELSALHVVAAVGGFSALFAGLIALTQNDLKRVLAYSTISQLGYMFLALGTGSLVGAIAGMFHLFTHAAFKALLFLGAGSVMHAMGNVIDMRRFGGLRRLMPITHWTFAFGALALAALAPFAGFWSKDLIFAAVEHEAHGVVNLYRVLFWAASLTATLTAIYTFRAFFLTFYGEEQIPPEAGHHAHESPRAMTGPLVVLAFAALFAGVLLVFTTHGFVDLLQHTPQFGLIWSADAVDSLNTFHKHIAVVSTLLVVVGIGLAAYFFLGDRREVAWLSRRRLLHPLYLLSLNKFYIDEIYYVVAVWPWRLAARGLGWFDRVVIDRLVDLCGKLPPLVGSLFRSLQSGMVQFYALAMVLGLLVLLGRLVLDDAPPEPADTAPMETGTADVQATPQAVPDVAARSQPPFDAEFRAAADGQRTRTTGRTPAVASQSVSATRARHAGADRSLHRQDPPQ